MKRKKVLALLCFLLAGVCVMGIIESQIQAHGQSTTSESASTYSVEETMPADGIGEQKINYESATVYYPDETADAVQSKTVSHTYIPNS